MRSRSDVRADGLPASSALEERVARAVAGVATTWFALAAAWELFGPLLAGHYASSASVGIIAENMLRFRIPGPVWEYTAGRPGPEMYYCHHPWGIFWTTAAFMAVLGRHDFVCRLPAVLLSAATPLLLYAIGRAAWRPAAGAAAAAAFVVLPIALAFASFNALEVPVIAYSLLALWGYVRLTQTWRRRWLAVSTAGAFLAVNADWPAFVLAAEMLAFGMVRGVLLPGRAFGPVHPRRYAQWWALLATTAVLVGAGYFAYFTKIGKTADLLGSYALRSAGGSAPLSAVLASRRYWIELSFSPIAIVLGKVAAVVSIGRLVWLRREHELLPLAVLGMALFQYLVFKQGADIHVFWPHYFAAYFGLAMGALVATAASAFARLPALPGPLGRASDALRGPGRAAVFALALALLVLSFVARDGVPALAYARATGGRFNEKGLIIESDGAKTAFLEWLGRRIPRGAAVDMHEGMKATWAQVWTLGGRIVRPNRPVPRAGDEASPEPYLADTRFLAPEAQAALARDFRVTAVGPFWSVQRGLGSGPIEAFSFAEREPSLFEWYFLSGTEPQREVVPDAFLAWELRTHFGQSAAPPEGEPETLEHWRILHNVALAAGDEARAAAIRARIEGELAPVRAAFDGGTEILGTTFRRGASPLLTILVRAGGPMPDGTHLAVRSKVVARAPLSSTMADPVEREVGLPLAIPPQAWRPGFLHADPVPIQKRPGTEVFRASFIGRGKSRVAKRTDGGPAWVEVLRLD